MLEPVKLEVSLLSRQRRESLHQRSCGGQDPTFVVLTHCKNRGVYRVHNYSHHCLGTDIPTSFEECPGDASIDSKRSSQVIPGFYGILAGRNTRWHPVKHSSSLFTAGCDRSMANPNMLLGYFSATNRHQHRSVAPWLLSHPEC